MATATYSPERTEMIEENIGEWLDQLLVNDFHNAGLYLPEERTEIEAALRRGETLRRHLDALARGLDQPPPFGRYVGLWGSLQQEQAFVQGRCGKRGLFAGLLPGIGPISAGALGAIGGLFGGLDRR